jgi:hypothetical protein
MCLLRALQQALSVVAGVLFISQRLILVSCACYTCVYRFILDSL